jgi:hypothetical protein
LGQCDNPSPRAARQADTVARATDPTASSRWWRARPVRAKITGARWGDAGRRRGDAGRGKARRRGPGFEQPVAPRPDTPPPPTRPPGPSTSAPAPAGAFTLSALEGKGSRDSPQTLVTTILRADFGGWLSPRSPLFQLGWALGLQEAFMDRLLMTVMVLREEVEFSK